MYSGCEKDANFRLLKIKLRRNPKEILELKSTTEVGNLAEGFKANCEQAEASIGELENRTT